MTGASREEWLLAIRLRQLGDVLASLEVLRAIKEYRPERRIALVVNAPYAELVDHEPYIDCVLTPPKSGGGAWIEFLRRVRALSPSAVIDLHGSARAALITLASGAPLRVGFDLRVRRRAYTVVEPRGEFRNGQRVPHHPIIWGSRLARHVGCAAVADLPPALTASGTSRERARSLMREAGVADLALAARRVIGLNPGRPVASKSWSSARFVELARKLKEAGHAVMVFWGPGEQDEARWIARESGVVCGPTLALADMPAALSWCAALVTIDSGLKHLAVCARTPTVTLFGSTDPREWHMGGARDVALWKGFSCSPCRRLQCPFGTPCMDFEIEDVLRALEQVTGARS